METVINKISCRTCIIRGGAPIGAGGSYPPTFFTPKGSGGTKIDDNNTRLQACNVFSGLSQIKRF